jgi:uncharacterized membrane protein YfcA
VDTLPYFIATGIVAGLMAGLFGVGGGLIMVPILALVLGLKGFPPEILMQVSIGTSLAVIAFTSISSTRSHHKRDGVVWPVFWRFAPGLVVGALIGAWTAHLLSGVVLARMVGIGAILVAAKMVFDSKEVPQRPVPGGWVLAGAGTVIGWLSSLVGIGGGSLTVPFLNYCGIQMRQAVGTAAAGGIPIAWAGAVGFVIAGWGLAALPPGQLGYVSIPGFLSLVVASVLVAPLGAKLAHSLPQLVLKRAFALLLLVIGITMLTR